MQKRNELSGLESLLASEVAERQALERELRQREERLGHLFNSVPVGLAVVDSAMRYLRVNDELARINGLPAEEHRGKTIHEVVPNIAPAVEAVIREALTSRRPILNLEVVGEVFAAPGQTGRWLLFFIPLTLSVGDSVAVLVYEAGAHQPGPRDGAGEAKYAALFEHTSDAVLLSDAAGHLLEANPRAVRALGYAREELLRLRLHELLAGEHESPEPSAPAGLREGEVVRRGCRVRRGDGSHASAEAVFSAVGEGRLLCVLRLARGVRHELAALPGVDARLEPGPGYELKLLKNLAAAMAAAAESLEHSQGPGAAAAPQELDGGVQFYEEVVRFERDLIRRALRKARGNQKAAAELLGINATTLHAMLKRYDIRPDDFKRAEQRLTVVGGQAESA